MGQLKITTNIPYVHVIIFNHQIQLMNVKQHGTSKPIPYFSTSGSKIESVSETIEIDLEPGLYKVRLELPYYRDDVAGNLFSMPVMMDRLIEIREDKPNVEFNFSASLTVTEN